MSDNLIETMSGARPTGTTDLQALHGMLIFQVPDSILGGMLEDISGVHEGAGKVHPLKGARYLYVYQGHDDPVTLMLFPGDIERSLVEVYANWCMRNCYYNWETPETRRRLDEIKHRGV